MPHDRSRRGTLTNAQVYEAHYGEKRSVPDLAKAEGVSEAAIYGRIAAERKRRQAAGEVVHRRRKGRRPLPKKRVLGKVVTAKPAAPPAPPPDLPPSSAELLATFTRSVVDLSDAITRL